MSSIRSHRPVRRRVAAVAFAVVVWCAAVAGDARAQIAFDANKLQGTSSVGATTLQWGPDGRLYVGQYAGPGVPTNGLIKAYTVAASGGGYVVTATETINLVAQIPNHNDGGAAAPGVTGRLLTGIAVTGTAQTPVIYATSSDPRIGGAEGTVNDTNLDTNSGVVSRLTKTATGWTKLDLVRGLPRSEENHAANGLLFDAPNNRLLVAQGGNTNMGAPSTNFALLPEYELSAAILSVNLAQIGNSTYDIPTRANTGPFGGNDGANQAKIVPGGPVQVFSPGFRNPYDVVKTQLGKFYTIDNGGNPGWGGPPQGCTNTVVNGGGDTPDFLHAVSQGYYGGHPNPTRAAITGENCSYLVGQLGLANFGASSTNGVAEYTASNFGGALKGDLVAVSWAEKKVFRIDLNAAGTAATTILLVSDTRTNDPGSLPGDITTQGDQGQFPGSMAMADQGTGSITIYTPADCNGTGVDSSAVDDDGDGYSNHDELVNGTNWCSQADVPSDNDGDKLSDRLDGDDDNDGLGDVADPFQVDPANGNDSPLPVALGFDSGGTDRGLLATGFTGLMVNGVTDYLDQFSVGGLTTRGAAGVFTITQVDGSDAYGSNNTQRQAFQFGVGVTAASGPFTVRARIATPFDGGTPQAVQAMGVAVGTGDQDNYVKLVVTPSQVIAVREVDGTPSAAGSSAVALPGPSAIDLLLQVDPASGSVRPAYRLVQGGQPGPLVPVGGGAAVPRGWFSATTRPAVSVIGSSGGGDAFASTYDEIVATPGAVLPGDPALPSATATAAGGPVATKPAVRLWAVRLSTRTFRAARSGGDLAKLRAKVGTLLTFNTSEAGRARVTAYKLLRGRLSGKRCVPAAKARKGRACDRTRRIAGSVAFAVKAGRTQARLTGRVGKKRLMPGRYELRVTVTTADGRRSPARRLEVKVR